MFTWTFLTPIYHYPSYQYGRDDSAVWIAIGVIFGLKAISLIILAIIYYKRQKKRKAWYGPMAAHYRNGGLPPWAGAAPVGVGDGSIKSPMVSPTQGAYPTAQYEKPNQVGVYGNLPTIPYEKQTGVTGYTAASYHTANSNSIPQTPIPQSLSPQPRHSQYSSTSFEPYSAPPVRHPIMYSPPPGTPTQFSPPLSPAYGAPAPQGVSAPYGSPAPYGSRAPYGSPAPPGTPPPPGTPAPYGPPPHGTPDPHGHAPTYTMTYDPPPREPEYVEASGSAQAPAYSGGPYTANEYPKEKR